jgi:hypothetical protein
LKRAELEKFVAQNQADFENSMVKDPAGIGKFVDEKFVSPRSMLGPWSW